MNEEPETTETDDLVAFDDAESARVLEMNRELLGVLPGPETESTFLTKFKAAVDARLAAMTPSELRALDSDLKFVAAQVSEESRDWTPERREEIRRMIGWGANIDPVLCYVEDNWAYFTTQALEKQWGDDWDDAPYEHNAGEPYEYHGREGETPWEIVKVAWDGELETPEHSHRWHISVQRINAGEAPWLVTPSWVKNQVSIKAGTSLSEFCKLVKAAGGTVYFPRK